MVQRRWGARAVAQVAGSPFGGGALASVRQNGELGFDSARIWVKKHVRGMGNLPSASVRLAAGRTERAEVEAALRRRTRRSRLFRVFQGSTAYQN